VPDSSPSDAPARRPWGRWVLYGLALLLLLGLAWLKWGLDPWLRRKLEQQATTKTHGQYRLQVAALRTDLLARSLHLRGLALRPATPTLADTLPRLEARLASLDLHGVGLLALVRGGTLPLDSLIIDSLRVHVAALPRRPAPARPALPLYQQQPLRLGYLRLRRVGGSFGPAKAPTAALATADVRARDLLFTAAGAADTQRLAFAGSWRATLHGALAELGGHRIEAGQVAFLSEKQFFGLDSLRITPPAPGKGTPGAVRVAYTMPRVRVHGLRAAAWQHQQHLQADSARLSAPHLTFRPPAQAPPPLWKLLRPVFRRADVRQLSIDDGYIAVAGVREQPAVRHLFGTGRGLRIDSLAEQPTARRILYARAWLVRTGRITGTFVAPVYPASIEHAFLNTDKQVLRFTTLALWPTLTPAQLNRRSGYQTTQLTIRMAELRAQGFDFQQLSANSHLRIAHVTAERPFLQASSDGRGPINHKPSYLSPELVRRVRAHFDVRQLDFNDGTIVALARSATTPLVGKFTINRLNVRFHNVTNDPRRMSLAHPLTATATGYLQNTCRAEVALTTSLLDPRGRQHLRGSFGPAPFSILNPIMKPTRLISFESGQAQRIDFDERLDRQRIRGEVRARYTDLKLKFLAYKEEEVKKTLFTRLKTGVANLVVRNQNPRPGGRFVVGDMDAPRELEFSVFTAWRQGLITGFLNSVGVPQKMATDLGQSGGGTALPPGPHAPPPTSPAPAARAERGPKRWLGGAIRRVKRLAKRLRNAVTGGH
jgi:hypothetical protein